MSFKIPNLLNHYRLALSDYDTFLYHYLNTIARPNDKLKPINAITAYWLKQRQLGQIEHWSPSVAHNLTSEQLDEGIQFISDSQFPIDYYIYPASLLYFFRELFGLTVTPILAHALYDAMNSQGLILGVGAGKGYATLFKYPASLEKDFYEDFIQSYKPDVYKKAISDLKISRKPASLTAALRYAEFYSNLSRLSISIR